MIRRKKDNCILFSIFILFKFLFKEWCILFLKFLLLIMLTGQENRMGLKKKYNLTQIQWTGKSSNLKKIKLNLNRKNIKLEGISHIWEKVGEFQKSWGGRGKSTNETGEKENPPSLIFKIIWRKRRQRSISTTTPASWAGRTVQE